MARPRKPTAVKAFQGTLQPCRTNTNEPVPKESLKQVSEVGTPIYLTKEAQEFYNYALEHCPEGMISSLDFSILAGWAETQANIVECEVLLGKEGKFIFNEQKGCSVPHPVFKEQNNLRMILKTYVSELGFTPASRSKVSVKKADDENKNPFIDI